MTGKPTSEMSVKEKITKVAAACSLYNHHISCKKHDANSGKTYVDRPCDCGFEQRFIDCIAHAEPLDRI